MPDNVAEKNDSVAASSAASVPHDGRLPWLIAVLLLLVIVWAVPYLLQQWSYRWERGKLAAWRAEFDHLDEPKLAGINQLFAGVAKRLQPSVVHIQTQRRTQQIDELASIFGERYQRTEGEASGVIVDTAGYVVTNYHVIAGATEIVVHLSDGKRHYPATVIGSDPKNDLAVVKISAPDLIPAEWGDSDQLEVAQLVWAIGTPFGLDNTVTMGIVSAKGRRGVNEKQRFQEYLQSDAAVNPGNSGGPLVDLAGRIVGINTAIVGPTYQGISFAIPSNVARELYQQIISQGKIPNGYLGVGLTVITEELRQRLQLGNRQGVVVTAVGPNTPAEASGLRPGDIIQSWGGRMVEHPDQLTYLVARTAAGTKVPLEVLRGGQLIRLEVVVGERPAALR